MCFAPLRQAGLDGLTGTDAGRPGRTANANQQTKVHMKATNLTEQMSTKDIQAVESALKSLRQKAPQLVTLTLQERGLLRPPTHERLALMSRTLDAAKEHAGLLPQQFDLDAFKEQVAAVQGLDRCLTLLHDLESDLKDTLCVYASDPLKATAEIRAYVVAASVRTPALEELARRLRKPRGKATRTEAAQAKATPAAAPRASAAPPAATPTATPDTPPPPPSPMQDKVA